MIMKRSYSFTPRPTRRSGAASFRAHPPPRTNDEATGSVAVATAIPPDAIDIGSTVRILVLRTGEREEYTLVPPGDADILQNRISTLSPIGQAIFGRRAGETVEVDAPAGSITVRIERVRRARKEGRRRH
jgi:transcription elongation GreA/GreB family factor